MTALSLRYLRRKLSTGGLMPKSLLSRLALILVVIELAEYLLIKVTGVKPDSSLELLFTFTSFLLICVLFLVALRWLRRNFMWRLRNRLIVTYVFIGVIPVVLLVCMAILAGYLFAGQFSTFVITGDLQSEFRKLQASNSTIAAEIAHLVRQSPTQKLPERSQLSLDTREFKDRHITAWRRGQFVILQGGPQTLPLLPPEQMKDSAVVVDDDQLFLRSVSHIELGKDKADELTVVSSVPLDVTKLQATAADVGVISVYSTREQTESRRDDKGIRFNIGGRVVNPNLKLQAGTIPPGINRADIEFQFGTFLNVTDWNSGKTSPLIISIRTRPSLLYARLFRSLGDMANVIIVVLMVVAVVFAVIELIALIIGIRLTRTMTKSVASLYDATQHINAGNFAHRIRVTSQDQLAALETSFNSMTASLEQLIAEQKEKQRIESELAIAQEVQALLFPRDITEVESLEVHGICKPARTVSGDYYDFLPVGADRLGIAVGDISGKGISAALLMATVHAFVRAYTLVEKVPALATPAVASHGATVATDGNGNNGAQLPPGTLLSMLNSQLYRSTPTEKYATMFLGFFDESTRKFNYSNAGHLPPLIIGNDGSLQRLDTGGLVVGLFGDVTYPDDSVEMQPGDIFVAYSDGITEPENEFGEFGEDRLISLIQENRHLPLARITDIILAAVTDWIGYGEQPDDMTLVLARAR